MNEKMISIIVPVYNSEKYLEKCIESVLGQTYRNWELILINDGSNDNSIKIIEKYEQIDNRIVFINKDNEGVSKTRNCGLKIANGYYISFLDSDDFLAENFCEIMIKEIEKKESNLVLCGFKIWKDGILLRTPSLNNKTFDIKENFEQYKYAIPIFASPCNKVYLKKYLKAKFLETLSLGEDLINNLNYIKNMDNGLVSIVNDCLYNVQLDNNDSLNRKFDIQRGKKIIELRKAECKLLSEIYNDDNIDIYLNQEILVAIHFFLRDITLKKNKNFCLEIIESYINDKEIRLYVKRSSKNRIDYKILKILFLLKCKVLIYYYFFIKVFIRR